MRVGIGHKILLAFLATGFATTMVGVAAAILLPQMPSREYLIVFTALLVGAVLAKVLSQKIAHEVGVLVAATRVISEGDLSLIHI